MKLNAKALDNGTPTVDLPTPAIPIKTILSLFIVQPVDTVTVR
jgi:hypothetical protein